MPRLICCALLSFLLTMEHGKIVSPLRTCIMLIDLAKNTLSCFQNTETDSLGWQEMLFCWASGTKGSREWQQIPLGRVRYILSSSLLLSYLLSGCLSRTHTHTKCGQLQSHTISPSFSFLLPCCLVTRSSCRSPWRISTRAHTLVSVKERSSTHTVTDTRTSAHLSNLGSVMY